MSEPVPEEEQGGDPPCWAAQFADDEDGEADEEGDPAGQVPQKGPVRPTPRR
jgi:hypothetical protein